MDTDMLLIDTVIFKPFMSILKRLPDAELIEFVKATETLGLRDLYKAGSGEMVDRRLAVETKIDMLRHIITWLDAEVPFLDGEILLHAVLRLSRYQQKLKHLEARHQTLTSRRIRENISASIIPAGVSTALKANNFRQADALAAKWSTAQRYIQRHAETFSPQELGVTYT